MLLLTLLAALGADSSGLTVELAMNATCRGTEIELEEIATLHGDAALVERAGALEVGYAPSPGHSRVLRADHLAQLLERKLPGVEVTFTGDRRTRVAPEVVVVPAARLESVARAELETVFGLLEADFELNHAVAQAEVPAAADDWSLRARPGSIVRPTSGVFTVPVEIYVEGQLYRMVWTSWRANVYETRPVLARTVRAGEKMTADMFERQRVRVTPQNDRSPIPAEFLQNAVANRNLAPGESVEGGDVFRHPVVQPGARLQLLVTKGRIRATVAVEALYAGAIGDRIRVKNLLTQEHLTAVVHSRDLVEIDLSH